MKTINKNIFVYIKSKDDKKFHAIASLKKLTYAPNLMHAVVFKQDKLQLLKDWCDSLELFCKDYGIKIELRHYKGKTIYSV